MTPKKESIKAKRLGHEADATTAWHEVKGFGLSALRAISDAEWYLSTGRAGLAESELRGALLYINYARSWAQTGLFHEAQLQALNYEACLDALSGRRRR